MTKKTSKRYSTEFKKEAVNLVEKQCYSNTEASKSLGVSESAIRQWKKKFGSGADKKQMDQSLEIKRLHKENERLRMEREILKNPAAFFAKENL